jgi:inhibitor of KinA sporulation pathway (predicted exonuclease)
MNNSILVVDLEMTCWRGHPPSGQEQEIIDIGLCAVAPGGVEVSQPHDIWVKPIRSEVSRFCTQITGITDEDLDDGQPFSVAGEELKKYSRHCCAWGSYGLPDKRWLEIEYARLGRPGLKGMPYINIRKLVRNFFSLEYCTGLAESVRLCGKRFVGKAHTGGVDAYNAAVVLGHIMRHSDDKNHFSMLSRSLRRKVLPQFRSGTT